MRASLAGVDLRLARADEHLALLNGQRTLFLHDKGNRVVGHFDRKAGDYIFRAAGDPPPLNWGITFGEYIHALRAALDNRAAELVHARGGSETVRPDFSIYEYETDSKGNSNAAKIRIQMPHLRAEDYAFIEGCQPYQVRRYRDLAPLDPELRAQVEKAWVEWHALSLLREFDDADKHRHLHVGIAAVGLIIRAPGEANWVPTVLGGRAWVSRLLPNTQSKGISILRSPDGSVVNDPQWHFGINPDDRTEIARAVGIKVKPGRQPKMEMEPSPVLEVAFGYRERPLLIADLFLLRDAVRDIVEHFRPVIG